MSNIAKIVIEDLVVPVRIGVYDHEKENAKKQNIIVNVSLYTEASSYLTGCSVESIIDYDRVYHEVLSWQEQDHILLIETYMMQLLKACFSDARIFKVEASIGKPDILPYTKNVGVSVCLTRDDWNGMNNA